MRPAAPGQHHQATTSNCSTPRSPRCHLNTGGRLMVTVDSAGASHGLITRLDELAGRPGYELTYSVGWELATGNRRDRPGAHNGWQDRHRPAGKPRERRARTPVPNPTAPPGRLGGAGTRRGADPAAAQPPRRRQAGRLAATMRIFARREHPHPGAQLSLVEQADGCAHPLGDNMAQTHPDARPKNAYIDAAHRVHARVEDRIRTGKGHRDRPFPVARSGSQYRLADRQPDGGHPAVLAGSFGLDGELAAPSPRRCATASCHTAARLVRGGRRRRLRFPPPGPGRRPSPTPGTASAPSRKRPDDRRAAIPAAQEGSLRGTVEPPATGPPAGLRMHTPGSAVPEAISTSTVQRPTRISDRRLPDE